MWEIEYGADFADSYEIRTDDWDKAMESLSRHLAEFVDNRLIDSEEFEQAMEWVTGVVIDDEGVPVPFTTDGLSVMVTRWSKAPCRLERTSLGGGVICAECGDDCECYVCAE